MIFLKGQCEMVMLGEDIPKQLKSNGMLQCYPGMEESDDEDLDALAESYDIQMGTSFFLKIKIKKYFFFLKNKNISFYYYIEINIKKSFKFGINIYALDI